MRKFNLIFHFCMIALFLSGCVATRRARTERIEKVISSARSYIGTPYKYGGMSRSGIDCSGLLVLSFKSAGLEIPRTSKEQSKYGKKVQKDELKSGDLVFFSAKPGKRKISHAGLVTDVRGNNSVNFIHSSTKLGVVETDLLVDYYQKIFVKARRPKY